MSDTIIADDPDSPVRPPGQDDLPWSDGEPMESERHADQLALLIDVLRHHYRDREDVFVGGNMGLYYSLLQGGQDRFKAPDFFVSLGAIPRSKRDRKSWVVWEEGRAPDVVIELLSPRTASRDRGEKKDIYARDVRVTEYYLFDPANGALDAFTLVEGRYVPSTGRTDGAFDSHVLGLRLVVVEGVFQGKRGRWLRFRGPDGRLLPTAEERAAAAEARAQAEAERADRLAAKLRAAGIEPD
jgi:Uma2 family endonuclease